MSPRSLALGSNTDPYQPVERTLKLTRAVLEVLDRFNHPVSIVTKSAGVLRDLDILTRMAARKLARVYRLGHHAGSGPGALHGAARRHPRPAACRRSPSSPRAGVPAGVMVAPMIPGLNDAEMERIMESAARAGARHAGYVLLRLPHELRQMFEDWLQTHFPDRARHVLNLIRETRAGALSDPRFHHRFAGQRRLCRPAAAPVPARAAAWGLDEAREGLGAARGLRFLVVGGPRSAEQQAHFVLGRDRSGQRRRKGMSVTGVADGTRYARSLLEAFRTPIGTTCRLPTPRLATDFRLEPHWWDAAPRPTTPPDPLPAEADVAIIGSGITGLNAALHLARGGRHVVVLDRGVPGVGASSRNAGYIGRTFKHSFGKLLRKRGPDFAITVYRELQAAFDAVAETVHTEQIECHFSICGRYIMAVSPAQYEQHRRRIRTAPPPPRPTLRDGPARPPAHRNRLGRLSRRRGHSGSRLHSSRPLSPGSAGTCCQCRRGNPSPHGSDPHRSQRTRIYARHQPRQAHCTERCRRHQRLYQPCHALARPPGQFRSMRLW